MSSSVAPTAALLAGVLAALTPSVAEAQKPKDQDGLGLKVGALVPLRGGYAGADVGVTADATYWYELGRFAIEPRIGFATSADTTGDKKFYEVPMDVGAYYVVSLGNVALFFGGGAGARWLYERRRERITVGRFISTEHIAEREDKGFAFGAFARMGTVLFRSSSVRLTTTIAYNFTLKTINEHPNPQSITAGIGLFF